MYADRIKELKRRLELKGQIISLTLVEMDVLKKEILNLEAAQEIVYEKTNPT